MPEVAFVTRTFASRTFQSQGANNVGNEVGVGYTLRTASGQNLGSYRSVSEAQAAFAQRYGPNRILKWKQQDMVGDIEQHVAIGLPLSPREVWLNNLVQWFEPSELINSLIQQDVVLETVRQIYDLSGSNNFAIQATPAAQPTVVVADTGFNDRQSLNFDGVDDVMLTPNLTTLSPPYTIIVVARALADPGDALFVNTAGDDLALGTNGAGAWKLRVGATTLPAGTLPPLADAAILTARVTATASEFRLNGVVEGTIAGVPAANGTVALGNGFDFFTGRIAAVMIAIGDTEPNDARILQTERYFRERYQ